MTKRIFTRPTLRTWAHCRRQLSADFVSSPMSWQKSISFFADDVKDAFGHIPVDPLCAATFGFVVNGYVMVYLRLQFGWRNSPGVWSLGASALEHAHNITTFQDTSVYEQGKVAVVHVGVVADAGRESVPILSDCERVPGAGGDAGDPFFVLFMPMTVFWAKYVFVRDEARLGRAIESLASDHMRLLGPPDQKIPRCCKFVRYWARVHVWGCSAGLTDKSTISLPPHKSLRLR